MTNVKIVLLVLINLSLLIAAPLLMLGCNSGVCPRYDIKPCVIIDKNIYLWPNFVKGNDGCYLISVVKVTCLVEDTSLEKTYNECSKLKSLDQFASINLGDNIDVTYDKFYQSYNTNDNITLRHAYAIIGFVFIGCTMVGLLFLIILVVRDRMG